MKQIFCLARQMSEQIQMTFYLLKIKKPGLINKTITSLFKKEQHSEYEIINEFKFCFPLDNSDKNILKKEGEQIREKLQAHKYQDFPITVALDLEDLFTSSFSLPKLSGKALQTSYKNEMDRQFGNLLDGFSIISKEYINQNKGYTYNLLVIKNNTYQQILDIFTTAKLKLTNVLYLPSLFANIFSLRSKNKTDFRSKGKEINAKRFGILIDDVKTYIFLVKKGYLLNYHVINKGYETINKTLLDTFKIAPNDLKKFKQENHHNLNYQSVIYQEIKAILQEAEVLMFDHTEHLDLSFTPELDKIYVLSTSSEIFNYFDILPKILKSPLTLINKVPPYQYQLFIRAFLSNQKNFVWLPLKVKG